MVGISSGEDIVSDIRVDVTGLVIPLNVGRHALDAAHSDAGVELLACIGVALHVVGTALPVPLRRPGDSTARGAVYGSALTAGTGSTLAPVVVVELVAARRKVVILPTKRGECTACRIFGLLRRDGAGSGDAEKQSRGKEGLSEHHG